VVFRESDLEVIDQPHVFDNDTCMGFPVGGANFEGRFGLSLVVGGNSSGTLPFLACSSDTTCAVRSYVSVADENTDFRFKFHTLTADGAHNPENVLFGEGYVPSPASQEITKLLPLMSKLFVMLFGKRSRGKP
jgi:hypothetical protein